MLESLDFATLKECRVVSKSWGKEATLIMAKKCKITFKTVDSLEEFLTIPASAEPMFLHVSFKFDVQPEAKSKAMQAFLQSHAKQLSTVESPEGFLIGSESVQEWATKLMQVVEVEGMNQESCDIKDNKNEYVGDSPGFADKPSPDEAAILDENANYMSSSSTDENSLHEIIIHDDIEDIKTKHESENVATVKRGKSVHFSMVVNPEYVPIPYCDEGYDNFADFYPYYLGEHSHEAGRRLHILGITNSILLIILGTFTLTPILYAVAIVQAYALAVGAHLYFDKHIPKPTIKNPIYMVNCCAILLTFYCY